jgi:ATP-dependent RNA helicase DHX30
MPALPIAEHKATILQAIENNPITIITGETGCGKSTQVRRQTEKRGMVWG